MLRSKSGTISPRTLFTPSFSMYDKLKFLSWVAYPLMEVSNGLMLPVQLRKLEFFVRSRLGLKILSFTPGVPIQLLFCRMFLLFGDVQLRMFLLTPTLFHCNPRGSSTLEFSRTFMTGTMLPPMTTSVSEIPTLTDKV